MSSFMKKLLAGSTKRPQEDDHDIVQLQLVEGQVKKITKELKKHCDALASVAKTEYRVAEELFQNAYGKQNDASSKSRTIAKRLPSLAESATAQMQAAEMEQNLTVRFKLDEEKLLLEPLKKYLLVFPHITVAVSRRDSKRQELEKIKAKVERYQGKSSAKKEVAVVDAKRAEDEFAKLETYLAEEVPLLYDGRVEFLDICLGSLLMAKMAYYNRMFESREGTLNDLGYADINNVKEETDEELGGLFMEISNLSIVSSMQTS